LALGDTDAALPRGRGAPMMAPGIRACRCLPRYATNVFSRNAYAVLGRISGAVASACCHAISPAGYVGVYKRLLFCGCRVFWLVQSPPYQAGDHRWIVSSTVDDLDNRRLWLSLNG
jgi:hypothetical protein